MRGQHKDSADPKQQPAVFLRYEGKSQKCHSLKEAKAAWDKLSPGQKSHASIMAGETLYELPEIERMH